MCLYVLFFFVSLKRDNCGKKMRFVQTHLTVLWSLVSYGREDSVETHLTLLWSPMHRFFVYVSREDWDETVHEGAQWLSGRVLDSRPSGRGSKSLTVVTVLCP